MASPATSKGRSKKDSNIALANFLDTARWRPRRLSHRQSVTHYIPFAKAVYFAAAGSRFQSPSNRGQGDSSRTRRCKPSLSQSDAMEIVNESANSHLLRTIS